MVDFQPGMNVLINSLPALVSLGCGLSSLSGLRAFLPLALVGLISRYQWFGPIDLHGTPFAFLELTWVIVLFFVLAVIEISADKAAVLDSAQDFVATPLRVLAGAVLFGAAISHEPALAIVGGMIAGAGISGAAHMAKGAIRPAATVSTAGTINPFISVFEDLAAGVGTVLVILFPPLGFLLLLFLVYLIYRVSRRRKRKYRGLRILRD
jgi:uncharacterized membrane protein